MNDVQTIECGNKKHGEVEGNEERARLRGLLVETGITHLEADYDGYGDSGCVGDIAVTPELPFGGLEPALVDLIWDIVCSIHGGFENNEGGEGTLRWDLGDDVMTLNHADRYVALEHYDEEIV